MEGTGDNRWSISDEVGSKVTYETIMQALCLAWIIPAIGLLWTGFANIGLRSVAAADLVSSVGRIQAMVVMLAIYTVPLGSIWALRAWPSIHGLAALKSDRWWLRPSVHLISLVVAVVALVAARLLGSNSATASVSASLAGPLVLFGSVAGFNAGLLIPRWLRHAPLHRTFPTVVLSFGVVFQATLGWQHLVSPGGFMSPLLVVEGLGLTWAAIAATRSIASLKSPISLVSSVPEEELETSSVEAVSQAPALQSLPKAAVGR